MQLFLLRSGLLGIMLLLLFGCSPQGPPTSSTWLDPAAINENIDKSHKVSPILEASEEAGVKEEEGPKVKDLTETADSRNRYLQKVKGPEPKTFPKSTAQEGILLNFDNADIYEVIQVMAETLNLNYIIDPQVKGTVNIRSGDKIPLEHLYDVFKKILNMNGLDIRPEGDYDYIFVAKKLTAPIIYGPDAIGSLKDSPRMVTQIVPMQHLSSGEAAKLLDPYLSDKGSIFDLADLNMIIITDFEAQIVDALVLLAQLDVSPLSTLKIRLIKIENAPLFDLSDELTEILTALKINKKDHEGVTITPLERVNSVLLMSSNEALLDTADKWVQELDVIPSQGRDNIYIYNVRNSVASDLEALVSSLISENVGASRTSASRPETTGMPTTTPRRPTSAPTTTGRAARKPSGASSSTLHFVGEPVLLADDSRNVILIRAMPSDYTRIFKLLERLDNLPRQVLIEVVVAEVNLTDEWQFGVEWALKSNLNINHNDYTGNYITNFDGLQPNNFGFTFSLLNEAGDIRALLHALASDTNLNVLSSPHVMVLNNETASVNVGQEVPIVTSQTLNDSTTTADTRTVQYRDTGIILTVTPRINYDGIIILEVEQQVSGISTDTVQGIDSPVIRKRELKTKLAVKDGQPILMGGLITTDVSSNQTGVPVFKDIPGLGWLFKYETESTTKRELLVMITPYVIESEDVLDQYIREFNKKMDKLRQELNAIATKRQSLQK
jgi:general secretion pathway protein D